ncbi:hypothetical protein Q31b_56580 [Novipirellula aureliae]|uniref:Uncharacterized protein n=1 Tax=Novipirellula aureliae TaxID=2527966 RepID=A0A5C6DEE9_9BACT|nr:hypothetical protein Q31b_56580 [Novipirellula aureliae]
MRKVDRSGCFRIDGRSARQFKGTGRLDSIRRGWDIGNRDICLLRSSGDLYGNFEGASRTKVGLIDLQVCDFVEVGARFAQEVQATVE